LYAIMEFKEWKFKKAEKVNIKLFVNKIWSKSL